MSALVPGPYWLDCKTYSCSLSYHPRRPGGADRRGAPGRQADQPERLRGLLLQLSAGLPAVQAALAMGRKVIKRRSQFKCAQKQL